MDESSLWYVFAVIVIVLLAADLWINRKPHHIPMKSALLQTAVWIGVALAFGVLLFVVTGDTTKTMEYYTAYAIEEAMSMDNLFVFIIIFAYFGIKDEDQHHALFYGIVGAIVFRAIFIFVGVELLERFDWLLYVFGVILLIVALKTTFGKDDDNKENGIAKFMRNRFDYVDTEETRGKLFAKVNGKRVVTVLLLCVIVIEMTDIVFALDSIPAVLAGDGPEVSVLRHPRRNAVHQVPEVRTRHYPAVRVGQAPGPLVHRDTRRAVPGRHRPGAPHHHRGIRSQEQVRCEEGPGATASNLTPNRRAGTTRPPTLPTSSHF